ncbi:MAG: biotin--[acetyl-CoA-carboxylase] ligase [Halarsenatibacteraceae bacterium]
MKVPFETKLIDFKIDYYRELDSTNKYIKDLDSIEKQEGLVIVAEKQLKGRGRKGKDWYSPAGSGLYFSIFLEPEISIEDLSKINMMIALAVYNVLKRNYPVKLKWPNDIYLADQKIAGILIESNLEGDLIKEVIVGVGCNTNQKSFPDELNKKAGSLFLYKREVVDNKELLLKILIEFDRLYSNFILDGIDYLKKWKEELGIIGQEIIVESDTGIIKGKVADIDGQGNLILEKDNGNRQVISSGDVSVVEGGYRS